MMDFDELVSPLGKSCCAWIFEWKSFNLFTYNTSYRSFWTNLIRSVAFGGVAKSLVSEQEFSSENLLSKSKYLVKKTESKCVLCVFLWTVKKNKIFHTEMTGRSKSKWKELSWRAFAERMHISILPSKSTSPSPPPMRITVQANVWK